MGRHSSIKRKTNETDISLNIELDSNKKSDINTGIAFLDHMLSHIAKHGNIHLDLRAVGDIEVDYHHTVEDIAICFGRCLKEALADHKGIRRYGFFSLPMEEVLANAALDICNRPKLVFNTPFRGGKVGNFDLELIKEFFNALSLNAGITIHINVLYGENLHHIAEGIFKSFAHALRIAISIDPGIDGVLSTKGII